MKACEDDTLIVAVADYQTAGRGQGTHTWESEPGKNLLFSLLMTPVNDGKLINQFVIIYARLGGLQSP